MHETARLGPETIVSRNGAQPWHGISWPFKALFPASTFLVKYKIGVDERWKDVEAVKTYKMGRKCSSNHERRLQNVLITHRFTTSM